MKLQVYDKKWGETPVTGVPITIVPTGSKVKRNIVKGRLVELKRVKMVPGIPVVSEGS